MKTALHMTLVVIFLFISLLTPSKGWTFVLPLDFVLKKTVSKTGRVMVSIDQEVTFKVGKESLKTQENWLVEGDKNLKVSVNGLDSYKENIKLNSLFNSKLKTQILGKNKTSNPLPQDFYQRLLFIRSTDSFSRYIKELNISEKTRLSRADGKICIAIGEPSNGESKYPQIWIDQDQFLIRKIRMPSGTEISLSNYAKITDDFWIAKSQTIKWAGATVTIQVKNFTTKVNAQMQNFYPQNFEQPTEVSFTTANPPSDSLVQIVDDFYKRFR